MFIDTKLWALTQGVRLRMLACALLGLLALASGIACRDRTHRSEASECRAPGCRT